nr:hypothetical protein [Xanthomonas populi]
MIVMIDQPTEPRRLRTQSWQARLWVLLLLASVFRLHAADSGAQGPYQWRSVAIGGGGFVTGYGGVCRRIVARRLAAPNLEITA